MPALFPQIWSFKESLPSHVRFVEHCFLSWEVFCHTRSPSLKVWIRSLNKRAGLPHRGTCIKILRVSRTLVEAKLASANVEAVFSGAGHLSMKSHCLGPQLLSDYAFLHYNYK